MNKTKLFRELVDLWLEKNPNKKKSDISEVLEVPKATISSFYSNKIKREPTFEHIQNLIHSLEIGLFLYPKGGYRLIEMNSLHKELEKQIAHSEE